MILRRDQVPQAVADAYNAVVQAHAATKGKRWDDPTWKDVDRTRKTFKEACRKAGIYPKKGRAGRNIYPTII